MSQDPRYHIEKISESVIGTKFEDIDKTTVHIGKLRILDLIGCALYGAMSNASKNLADLVTSWGGKKESTILAFGGKVPASNAAMVNSAVTRTTDYEAIGALVEGVDLPSHVSSTTVYTALALGEAQNASGKKTLASMLVGDDAAARLLAASGVLGGKNFEWGWDGNGTANAFGATALAGNMLGLNKKQMKDAFGLILNQMGSTFQNLWDYSLAAALTSAHSARNAICSAEMAKVGWDGPNDALFSRYGYFFLFTDGCADADILTKDIGKTFYSEATFKPYPSCRTTHAAVDCALKFISEHEIDTSKIADVQIVLPPRMKTMFTAQIPFKVHDTNYQVFAENSIAYCVATVLLRKEMKIDYLEEQYVRDPKIADIATKATIEDLELEDLKVKCAQLIVKTNDGKVYTSEIKAARGGYRDGLFTDEDVKSKFRYNVQYSKILSKDTGEKIIDMVDNLEQVDNINELTKLLVRN